MLEALEDDLEAVAVVAASTIEFPIGARHCCLVGWRRGGWVPRSGSRRRAARPRGTGAPAGRVNRFPPIALKWAAALLRHCDEPQHGIDLLGRDSCLLGKLLVTLGECAGPGEGRRVGVLAITLCLGSASQVHLWWLNTGRAAF